MTDRPVALVTGASAGIGLVFAERLAHLGYDLILVARRADRLAELAQRLDAEAGAAVETVSADLGDAHDLARVCERIAAHPGLAMLVNNAGYATRGRISELDVAAFEAMLRVNVVAVAALTRAALPAMISNETGTIINVASGTIFTTSLPGNAGYGASKSFVAHFTRSLAAETAGTGVRVQLLVPGVIATEFHAVAGNDLDRFPPERVMSAPDLVTASLRGLELGESVCIPSLPDVGDWHGFERVEAQLWANVSRDAPAARYHAGHQTIEDSAA